MTSNLEQARVLEDHELDLVSGGRDLDLTNQSTAITAGVLLSVLYPLTAPATLALGVGSFIATFS
jgi:hypothetical protein